ncbi:hypothetical protein [Paludisphaera mucosa]|uniref:HEAT repeat domain-containing protein n=1 Tax=Paludisphaera mucosa TaxID=3030827 RepID=A0ABT6FAZ3_9BACT|nr:hypothetical protein [Paludisphaera mucosa]MDG3004716.1 hypothetical protein [Paludisphaera mucosa]
MSEVVSTRLSGVFSDDRATQGRAYQSLLQETDGPVDWAYEVWDDLIEALGHKDNHVRSIAAQLLCNLSRSDPEARILGDFDALLAVTRDERFVTARHCLLALWKIGLAGEAQKRRLVEGLAGRFEACAAEKNVTLIRFDVVQGLRKLYDRVKDESIRETALGLIATESDAKYRKKYSGVWKT